jgi:hypothetical protein
MSRIESEAKDWNLTCSTRKGKGHKRGMKEGKNEGMGEYREEEGRSIPGLANL